MPGSPEGRLACGLKAETREALWCHVTQTLWLNGHDLQADIPRCRFERGHQCRADPASAKVRINVKTLVLAEPEVIEQHDLAHRFAAHPRQ